MPCTSCELGIIGGGPAGMAAASLAASLGLDTILLDEQPEPGGQIYRGIETVQRKRASDLTILGHNYAAGATLAATFRASGSAYEPGSVVWQVREDGRIGVSREGASRMLTAQRILIATGAMERPVPIPGWTLPGVMGAGAAQALLKASGVVAKAPVVIVGTGPLIYLYLGAIVETAPSAALFRHPRHHYTRALLSAVPVPDPDAQPERVVLRGEPPSAMHIPSGCRFHTRCPAALPQCQTIPPVLTPSGDGRMVACHNPC